MWTLLVDGMSSMSNFLQKSWGYYMLHNKFMKANAIKEEQILERNDSIH